MRFDVAVVGLGGMGSAIAAHCARRGASVIGLEQFESTHDLGSSSGKSRMIRKAYFEDAAYVPLLLRAYDLWRELERKTDTELLRITGLLMVGEEKPRSSRAPAARPDNTAFNWNLFLRGKSRRGIRLLRSSRGK
jgi:sarcosine oxidase